MGRLRGNRQSGRHAAEMPLWASVGRKSDTTFGDPDTGTLARAAPGLSGGRSHGRRS